MERREGVNNHISNLLDRYSRYKEDREYKKKIVVDTLNHLLPHTLIKDDDIVIKNDTPILSSSPLIKHALKTSMHKQPPHTNTTKFY